jgi:hypothetical protein
VDLLELPGLADHDVLADGIEGIEVVDRRPVTLDDPA